MYDDHHETTITNKMQSTRTNAKKLSKTIGQHASPGSGVVGMQQMKLIVAGLYQTLQIKSSALFSGTTWAST